ncbi:MAG: DNA-binding transcriptional regulator WhiA [Candidatus Azotimanducaceae bacterium]|jgi:DNA-binding transcriptional regulator WhiA
MEKDKSIVLAYIVGVALGDGNLSNPNGRATRLRVTCDANYPKMALEIQDALSKLFPDNKVSIQPGPKTSYFNISIYSNKLNDYIPWQVNKGPKTKQKPHVPDWILADATYTKACLRGLIQTDGSIYTDRGYRMVNFTNNIKALAEDVLNTITELGYSPHMYQTMQKSGNIKYTVRLSKEVDRFISEIELSKK